MAEPHRAHYFDEQPAAASRPRTVRLDLPDLSIGLTTDAGTFSADAIDAGTKILLLTAPPPAVDGPLLDLGCGYGPIAIALALRHPDRAVWAVDVNERARSLCATNAASAGCVVTVAAPDDVPDDLRVGEIWSNPPIRIGKPALHALLERWLDRLLPGGRATLVVHKHLGADSLQRWLDAAGYPTQRLSSRQGYRILQATAPDAQP